MCQKVCQIIYETKKTARRLILAVFVHYVLFIIDMIESLKITCYSQILSISCIAEVKFTRKSAVYFCKPRNQIWIAQIRIIVNVNFEVVILRSLFFCHEINSKNRRFFTIGFPYVSETKSFISSVIAKAGQSDVPAIFQSCKSNRMTNLKIRLMSCKVFAFSVGVQLIVKLAIHFQYT